jgi:hypothetical protein
VLKSAAEALQPDHHCRAFAVASFKKGSDCQVPHSQQATTNKKNKPNLLKPTTNRRTVV